METELLAMLSQAPALVVIVWLVMIIYAFKPKGFICPVIQKYY